MQEIEIPSDDITVTTLSDVTEPVITKIGDRFKVIILTALIYQLQLKMNIMLKNNCSNILMVFNGLKCMRNHILMLIKKRNLSYTLKLDNYSEGCLYVRAIATDEAGNVVIHQNQLCNILLIKAAPEAPKSVNAVGNNGYIEISWIQGIETSL